MHVVGRRCKRAPSKAGICDDFALDSETPVLSSPNMLPLRCPGYLVVGIEAATGPDLGALQSMCITALSASEQCDPQPRSQGKKLQ